MLEAFQSLREELTARKQTEVDQTSFLASKPGTSSNSAVNLDLPPPRPSTNIQTEAMDVDCGGPSSVLPLRSVIKDPFDKFQHDFKAANLPEGKYFKPPSTSKWYRVGQPCFQDKIQELNTDFAKICITPKPSGAPMGKVPLPVLKELEHQARQNISTLNFTAAFAKTSSSCNASLEKCQHSIKSTVKNIKSEIQTVPILRKQQSSDMRKSLSTWIFGITPFLFNTGPSHVSANP